ncbi:MAG: flagellar basal body rod protein FlgC [Rickettsiaceae bacterium]|nr:flagellar basal body rod protein FlgC [Rickettsiaceae bacterium]
MKKASIFFIAIFFCFASAHAIEDGLLKAIEISGHGNKFQAERLKIAAENLANEDSTSTKPGGNPYKRKVIFAKNIYDKDKKTRLVKIKKYGYDKSDFKLKYDPSHPGANEAGYVKLPNVSKIIEKADATEAQRSYEANLGMIEISKQMIDKTLDLMR